MINKQERKEELAKIKQWREEYKKRKELTRELKKLDIPQTIKNSLFIKIHS